MKKLLASSVMFAVTFAAGCSAAAPDLADSVPDRDDPAGTNADPATPSPSASSSAPSDLPGASAAPQATDLHHSERGDPKNQPVVFIHGGPGANSMMFELTVQDAIAKKGFFVVAYDQRGSTRSPKGTAADFSFAKATQDLDDLIASLGLVKPILLGHSFGGTIALHYLYVVAYDQRGSTRSPKGTAADFSFAKATQDLDDLIASLGLVKPILLGHSFGGTIALHYLERFPGKAKGAVLVASPIDFPDIYETTLVQCASRYRMWGRFMDAQKVDSLRTKMFPQGTTGPFTYGDAEIGSAIECQSKAMLYFPPMPTQGDMTFMLAHGQDASVNDVNKTVGSGFQANDKIGHADLTSLLAKHKNEVAAIYAPSWDVMFSKTQLSTIQSNVRSWFTVANAGHFIFMDQPEAFTTTADQAMRTF